jgi:hypothetical protein
MPQRPTLFQWRIGDGPETVGIAQGDINSCARILNRAQERVLYAKEANDEGWVGSWTEMVFRVNYENPYLTTPRGVGRIEAIDICGRPVPLRNQFWEYMLFGNGRLAQRDRWRNCRNRYTEAATRNYSCTFHDLAPGAQQIQVMAANSADYAPNPQTNTVARVLVQGYDQWGHPIVTQDGGNTVQGEFVTLKAPFAMTVNQFYGPALIGLQKDMTLGEVQVLQFSPGNAQTQLIAVMEATETVAWYRRYYLHELPRHCCPCPGQPGSVEVTALAKLDLIPVISDPDYLLIQSLEALTLECQSLRMDRMDESASAGKADKYHLGAIRLLIGQLTAMEGRNNPSINWRPFGSAGLERLRVGMQ